MNQDNPEGMIDGNPAGGWESGDVADQETREQSDAATGDASLAASEAANDADRQGGGSAGEGILAPDGVQISDQFVESAEIQQGLDPDMVTDEQADR
ncbi:MULTISPECIES: hypothetical protein [Microbacterium]|uniref:Uncharacterized protein n=1 Tax=Microbacterium saccharophilum TaxID=1213358 RepID=A0A7Z7CV41_9MICO|nr:MULTISPECIES: hypothetical protein [Microbacterium]SFI16726.1 hypothetical protein SAMN04487751_0035 [Microbacterium saccharophilum]